MCREYIYSGSALLASIEGSTTTYHHQDHLSVRACPERSRRMNTNTSGSAVGQQGHYPFGQSWYASSTTTKWQFTRSTRPAWRTRSGRAFYERDAETTLDYAMFRYDNSRLGRFMTPDLLAGSLANPQSLNRYAYALNGLVNPGDQVLGPPAL
jgi:RHS repeat-associated protein